MSILIRTAHPADIPLIKSLICELAEYEKLSHTVVMTEELLQENLFKRKYAETLIAEYEHTPAGFALFFHNFSTFVGRPGLYLEDLYVRPVFRARGIGRALLRRAVLVFSANVPGPGRSNTHACVKSARRRYWPNFCSCFSGKGTAALQPD